MNPTSQSPLARIFTNLERWRHLPAYQLERRADIFFSAYLPGLIAHHTGVNIHPEVIPELPIQRKLIWPEKAGRTSVKVDYAVFAEDRARVFFVELKTDMSSRRETQDTYLERCVALGWRPILEGILQICQATQAHQKYGHLLHALAAQGYLALPEELDAHLWPSVRPGLRKQLRQIRVTMPAQAPPIEVIYLQPHASHAESHSIGFASIAAYIEQFDDPISASFAQALHQWTLEAGKTPPHRAD